MSAGYVASYAELLEWRYSWAQIWEMLDMLDLQDWIEWQSHAIAEALSTNNRGVLK